MGWAGAMRSGQVRFDEARQHATEIWQHLARHGTRGVESPVWVYQTCADVFDASGEPDRAHAAVEAGHHELRDRAEKIDEPEWRKAFLENVPEHRAIFDLLERLVAEGS